MYSNIKRIYTELPINLNGQIIIADKQHHYLRNVIRLKKNNFIKIFNGRHGEWLAKIIDINKKETIIFIKKKICQQFNSSNIWLFFSPIKNQRLNILIEKTTELGISKFIPIKTDRTNIKNINIKKLKQNAIEAAEQSERLDIPNVEKECKINDIPNLILDDRCLLFFDETEKNIPNLVTTMNKIKKLYLKWALLVGPEGGFSQNEKKKILKIKNVYQINLGRRILRSDTAAIVSLFCVQQFIEN